MLVSRKIAEGNTVAGVWLCEYIPKASSFTEALEELRVAAKISEEEGDTPTLSYIQDLIEQLNRALREVTFGVDRCSKGAPRRLSPREELEGNEAITTSRIKRTTCSRNDASASSSYFDYVEDEALDQHETGINVEFVGDLLKIKNLAYGS